MVLDDASPQAPEPTSDYASDSNSPWVKDYPLQVNPELVVHPDPFTLYFGFFGQSNWKRKFTANLAQRIENAHVLVQRAPTQEELDAFVAHTSRSIYYQRMGAPLGFLAGSSRLLYQARNSEKFHLYAPLQGTRITPQTLVEAGRNFMREDPLLAKQLVKMAGVKLFLWSLCGSVFSGVFAIWLDAQNTMTDQRLKQFVKDVRSQNPEDVRKRKIEAETARARPRDARRPKDPEIVLEGLEGSGDGGDGLKERREQERDREPQAGYPGLYSGGGDTLSRSSDYGDLDDGARRAIPPTPVEAPRRSVGFFDDEDDASPTAPEYRKSGSSDGGSGSAWERIRQQSQASGSSQYSVLKPSSRQPTSQYDSWSSTSETASGSDSRQEKEQAQADFDRLLESERHIPSDGESSGQSRGWGKWS